MLRSNDGRPDTDAVSSHGHVVEVRTYPVKSMDGSSLIGSDVTAGGLAGDRCWSVVDAEGAVVSARQAPGLREVQVTATDEGPRLDVPGVADGVTGPAADEALTSYVGAPVHLARAEGSVQEVAAVHLVSRQAVAAAIGTTSDDPACDIEAPRANLTLDLGATPPDGFERAWVGHELAIGDVVLRVNQVPKHCLGVYAEVVRPGRINRGDPIEVRD
jgi:MOSC domain-containing protein